MDPASTQATSSPTSLVIANHSLSMQLMTATGNPASGGSTAATSNKQPQLTRKVLSSDLSNYNLDHLYCHPSDKKTQQQQQPSDAVSPFHKGTAATAPTGGAPPPPSNTDMGAVLKEIKQLKAMLLLHLDLIQEQSDQLASKDKLVLSLRKENETLRLKVTELTTTAMTPSPAALPAAASAPSTTTTTISTPIVITKSGRFSKPVLPVVSVAKDDAANKVQPTLQSHQHFSSVNDASVQPSAVLLPKEEPMDSAISMVDQQQPIPDAKSEILKKFSNKLLANCSEKLNSLTATIETAMTSNLTVSHPAKQSPTDTKTSRLPQDENVCATIVLRSDSPIEFKPDIGALFRANNVQSSIIGERDGKLISKIILQRVQEDGEANAADLLTTFKVEDLGADVREILNDYVSSVKAKQSELQETESTSTHGEQQQPVAANVPVKLATPSQASRRRRRRLDHIGSKKRRRVSRQNEQVSPAANSISINDTHHQEENSTPKQTESDEILADPCPILAPSPQFIPPATRDHRSLYSGRRSFMTTKQLYATREWQMDEIADAVNHQIAEMCEDERPSSAQAAVEDVNLEIPRWTERELTPLSSSEGTEDISIEAFHKRHIRLELDEKKRKKWDIQRIREQRNVERLRRRLLKDDPTDVADGVEDVGTFYPPAENIKFVQITDDLPIQAFGEFIPVINAVEFGLPWQMPALRSASAASPAGHLRSSDRIVHQSTTSATSTPATNHTSIQFVKKKCVRRHFSAATTTLSGNVQASGGSAATAKSRSTKRSKR